MLLWCAVLVGCGAAPPPGPAGTPTVPAPATVGRVAPVGRTCPESHPIKGNASSMIYHLPRDDYYGRTVPEECFATAADAERAGYRRARR